MSDWWAVLLAGALGGTGAVLRSFLTSWRGLLPWGVMLGNTLAAMAIGYVFTMGFEGVSAFVILAGLAGGLSTFSGVAKDCFDFYHRGRLSQMLLNAIANLGVPVAGLLVITILV
jgi:fluoride ion exporter CrcB/FEX